MELKNKLGSALSGIYLHGSLVNIDGEGFSNENSDIDILLTTSLNEANERVNFLKDLKDLIYNIEVDLQIFLPNRKSLPILSICVATEFETTEGIHKNRNTRFAFSTNIFRPLNSENTSLSSIGHRLKDDLVGMHFSAWSVLAYAQKMRSSFVSPQSTYSKEIPETYSDSYLALPKDFLRNVYLFHCLTEKKDPAMETEDDIAVGFSTIMKILENVASSDSIAKKIWDRIKTRRPAGKGNLDSIKSEEILYLWELLSIETEKELKSNRRKSEIDVFNLADDNVTQELIKLDVTTFEVVDRAIFIYDSSDLMQDKVLPLQISRHDSIEIYEFKAGEFDDYKLRRLAGEWPEDIEQYLRQEFKTDNTEIESKCKVGFTGIFYSQNILNFQQDKSYPIVLSVRPLTYWITLKFNKAMAAKPNDKQLNNFREKYGEKFFKSTEDFQCNYPSQLFLEMAVVTSDGFVTKLSKNPRTSAQSLGFGEPVLTCGFEFGFSWQNHVESTDKGTVLNVEKALLDGLLVELNIKSEEVEDWDVTALVVQHIHLNTSLIGVVYLKITRGTLIDRFNTKHFKSCDFITAEEALQTVQRDKGTNKWHQTALARMNLIKLSGR